MLAGISDPKEFDDVVVAPVRALMFARRGVSGGGSEARARRAGA